jgi:hypothetical protein
VDPNRPHQPMAMKKRKKLEISYFLEETVLSRRLEALLELESLK